jgi:oligopeptide/dipeptide ABC transporter ATP-binding protein
MSNMIPTLEVRGLSKTFATTGLGRRVEVRAVRGVDLEIKPGESAGLVGESGCGKSTLARCTIRLLEPDAGTVLFEGTDLSRMSGSDLRKSRRSFQMIFQDPVASLDPRLTVAAAIGEPLEAHRLGTRRERDLRVAELMESVALDPALADRQPGMLSGGQQQRVVIARALALRPRLLIADEPVSALDASVQIQILNLLADLQRRLGLTLMMISHSLAVIHYMCAHIRVMYLGKIVEESAAEPFFRNPHHPYSRLLLASMPARPGSDFAAPTPRGDIPSPANPPPGCPFHPRCDHEMEKCRAECPELVDVGAGRRVACFLFD